MRVTQTKTSDNTRIRTTSLASRPDDLSTLLLFAILRFVGTFPSITSELPSSGLNSTRLFPIKFRNDQFRGSGAPNDTLFRNRPSF